MLWSIYVINENISMLNEKDIKHYKELDSPQPDPVEHPLHYTLHPSGIECIQITEKVSIPEQIIAGVPSAGSVVTTGGIAVVATASALAAKPLADLLLKVVKPTIKKVMKKIAAIRGKTLPVLSVSERRDEQRIRSHAIRKLKGKE